MGVQCMTALYCIVIAAKWYYVAVKSGICNPMSEELVSTDTYCVV